MGRLIEAQLEGSEQLKAALQKLGAQAPRALGGGMYREMETMMGRSKDTFVPVDTGALRASGQVHPPVYAGSSVSVTAGYGNSSVAYALRQHEDLSYRHAVGQAKYLEQPFLEMQNGLADRLAADISQGLR